MIAYNEQLFEKKYLGRWKKGPVKQGHMMLVRHQETSCINLSTKYYFHIKTEAQKEKLKSTLSELSVTASAVQVFYDPK